MSVFIITRKAVSSILLVVHSVRPYKLARPHVTRRRALKNCTVYVTILIQVASLFSISRDLALLTYRKES